MPLSKLECLASQNAQRLRDLLKVEEIAHEKLRKELDRHHESSRAERQDMQHHLDDLDSKDYRYRIVEEYRQGTLGKVEVVLVCKAGFDFMRAQLPFDLKLHPQRFHYPPRVANCLSTLQEIERRGGRLVLEVENGDEDDEELALGTCEDSAHDRWVSRPEEEGDQVVGSKPQPSPLPNSTTAMPPVSSSVITPSIVPALSSAQALASALDPGSAPDPSLAPQEL